MFSKGDKQAHHHHGRQKDIPKGCVAIKVGHGEDQQRFTVPVNYINHPLFVHLLKEAEEEYGFSQQGTITIPCQLKEFKDTLQHMIAMENKSLQHQHHLVGCFRDWFVGSVVFEYMYIFMDISENLSSIWCTDKLIVSSQQLQFFLRLC